MEASPSPGKIKIMRRENLQPHIWILIVIILAAAAMRVFNATAIMPWANFPIIGAIAVFTGAYFTKWRAVLISLAVLLISDLVINLGVYHGKFGPMYRGWYVTYLIFFVIVVVDWLLLKKVTVSRFVIASVASSLLHWLLADGMLWVKGSNDLRTMQPLSRDIDGLVQCYIQGIPFIRNYLLGTLVYGAIMFGIYQWVKRTTPERLTQPEVSRQ
jgi:hypothetical protein